MISDHQAQVITPRYVLNV